MVKKPTRRNRAPPRRKAAAPRKTRAKARAKTPAEPRPKAPGPSTTARTRRPPKAAMAAVAAGRTMSAWTAGEIAEAFRRFAAVEPAPKGELKHVDPYTLLVAVVLSAQATDAGVNKASGPLFAVAGTPDKMVALGEERLRDHIKTIGLYRTKAKNVITLSQRLIAEHGGKVPRDRAALEALPGVGRKTANVVLGTWFRKPHAHHWLILHGRYVCKATKPLCERCLIADLCKWPEKTADKPSFVPATNETSA